MLKTNAMASSHAADDSNKMLRESDALSRVGQEIRGYSLPSAGPDLFIALDIDGTVLHHNNTLSPRVGQAVRAHMKAGSHVCLATGRGIYGTQEALEKIGSSSAVAVCSNGAITMDLITDTFLNVHTFDPTSELEKLHAALPGAIFAVEALHEPRRLTAHFPDGELTGPSVILPIEELAIPHATRLTVRHLDMTSAELLHAVDNAGLRGVEYAIGWTAWLDVSPEGVSKASALEAVRSSFGIDTHATVAVGDGGNDIEMLRWAHCGVAMGTASSDVVEAADVVTTSVNEDGLALVLESLL